MVQHENAKVGMSATVEVTFIVGDRTIMVRLMAYRQRIFHPLRLCHFSIAESTCQSPMLPYADLEPLQSAIIRKRFTNGVIELERNMEHILRCFTHFLGSVLKHKLASSSVCIY